MELRKKNSFYGADAIEICESDYLFVKTSQILNSGDGLYTAITLYKDEIVCVFTGKILSNKIAKKLAIKGEDRYFINLPDGTIMDSMHTKCFAKYANDVNGTAKTTLKNNTIISLDDSNRVCLIAIRNIKSGEELFCSYGKQYWLKHH